MKTFLEFLNSRKEIRNISEGFSEKNFEKIQKPIDTLLSKHIDNLLPLAGYVNTTIDKTQCITKQYMVFSKGYKDATVFHINWAQGKDSLEVYSIDFFDSSDILYDYKAKSNLSIQTLGSSIVYFLPIIWSVVNKGDYNLSEKQAIELGRSIFKNKNVKESKYFVGALEYRIIEGLTPEQRHEAFVLKLDETMTASEFKNRKQQQAHDAYLHKGDSQEAKDYFNKVNDEYREVRDAVRGGAKTLQELKLSITRNTQVIVEIDDAIKDAEEKFKEERENPETVFKKMQGYVKMVIKGINPSVILCGAPGVGKTFRVKQQLKANNYNEGHNLFTIKGKCTPRRLYLALYEYQDKGQIILIDDADALVGPNAPEDCINILKAALDSTADNEGRLVSYGVSGKLVDDEGMEIPKRFYFNGGVIVITNWNAGKLDTALRGRSYIQDINFTTEEILEIIKTLMPAIDPAHLSSKSKIKAFEYLNELLEKDVEMEVSIRTFGICAKIFEATDGDADFTEDDAKSMIREQMRLQAARITGRGNKGKY